MNRLIYLPKLKPHQLELLQTVLPDWEIYRFSQDQAELLNEAEIIIGWNSDVEEACLQGKSDLRWIHAWGAGVEGFPMQALQHRNILLSNSSGVHGNPIAETIFAMMLSFNRGLHQYVRQQIVHTWDRTFKVREMHGDTVGIIGIGEIGKETARLAKAFHMKVLGLRRSGESAAHVDVVYGQDGLEQLLSNSDYVVNTLPLTAETHHMIGQKQFQMMKKNAIYINIGRGKTTDTEALLEALRNGQIAGAGLDVFEEEPLPESHPLWEMDNVIITPHTSGITQHYSERAFKLFMENLQTYIKTGDLIKNKVDFYLQY